MRKKLLWMGKGVLDTDPSCSGARAGGREHSAVDFTTSENRCSLPVPTPKRSRLLSGIDKTLSRVRRWGQDLRKALPLLADWKRALIDKLPMETQLPPKHWLSQAPPAQEASCPAKSPVLTSREVTSLCPYTTFAAVLEALCILGF